MPVTRSPQRHLGSAWAYAAYASFWQQQHIDDKAGPRSSFTTEASLLAVVQSRPSRPMAVRVSCELTLSSIQ